MITDVWKYRGKSTDIIRQLKYYFTFCCLFLAARVSLRGLFLSIRKPLRRGAGEWRYVPLHGAGCLPVNSVPAPESAIIPYTYSLIAPPHRGIHHASFF
ncbi:hypothetical protein HH140_005094 [Escherichia coli]|nr:hypothetical protein [Escherichia coli]